MRTTLILEPELLDEAKKLTGISETTSLVREGLRLLVARETARRLSRLGGSEPNLESIPRRRSLDTMAS